MNSSLWRIALLVAWGCQKPGPLPEKQAQSTQSIPAPGASGLAVGDPVPNLSAVAHTGERITLTELRGRPIVVYFYPKDDTPGCTVEAQEIWELWGQIQSTSALVLGISTDDAESHRAFAEKHALPFLLFSDTDGALARAFGVALRNGRAQRTTFVFGRDGKLSRVFLEVQPRGHANQILAALKAGGG